MVKVIEIFDDNENSDDEDVVIFDQTPCGIRMAAEDRRPHKRDASTLMSRHRWRSW